MRLVFHYHLFNIFTFHLWFLHDFVIFVVLSQPPRTTTTARDEWDESIKVPCGSWHLCTPAMVSASAISLPQCWCFLRGKNVANDLKNIRYIIQSQPELKVNKNPFTAKRLSPQSCHRRWVPPERDASRKQTNSQCHQGSLRCCRDVLETQHDTTTICITLYNCIIVCFASTTRNAWAPEMNDRIGVTELWTFRITGHRDAEVITEILVDAPLIPLVVDAFEHLEVTHHRNLGISRTSLVMSRQVVDKELHQIQSAAETTLCGSPLLLACTEPWTSMDFRIFQSKKNHTKHTQWWFFLWQLLTFPRGGSPRSATMLRTPSLSVSTVSKSRRERWEIFVKNWDVTQTSFLTSSSQDICQKLRQDASCNPSEHSGSSSCTKACHEVFWLLKSFWVHTKLEAFSRTLPIKNC